MSANSKPPAKIGTAIKRAIKTSNSRSLSFAEIKKYLLSMQRDSGNMPDTVSIKQYLKNAVDKGVLLKLDSGNYKVKETAGRRRSRNRSRARGRSSKRRSRSRKRSQSGSGKRRSRSRKRSPPGSRKRKRYSSVNRRHKPSGSARRGKSRRSKAIAANAK